MALGEGSGRGFWARPLGESTRPSSFDPRSSRAHHLVDVPIAEEEDNAVRILALQPHERARDTDRAADGPALVDRVPSMDEEPTGGQQHVGSAGGVEERRAIPREAQPFREVDEALKVLPVALSACM